MRYQIRILRFVDPSSQSAGQRDCSKRSEWSRSRERVHPRSSSHASQQQQLVVRPQNRVSNHFKVTTRSRRHTETGYTRTRKEKHCRKAAEYTAKGQEVQAHGFRWRRWRTLKNEPGTSSNSQATVPVAPLQQGPAASSKDRLQVLLQVMKTVSIAMRTVHRVRTLDEQYSIQIFMF